MGPFRTGSGALIQLGSLLGRGGEGEVYSFASDPGLAAKIYKPSLAEDRRDKIAAMAAAGWHAKSASIAFPKDALYDLKGRFAGFTMRRVGRCKPAHELYSPTDRKTAFPTAAYPFLIRAAANAARSIAAVHNMGCIVGDINHSGILVGQDATVVLIDCDSFQASYGGRIFPCKVGVPEFTPPELQGRPLGTLIRTSNHDAFGIAVLSFYTLMMGRHPFAGRWQGASPPSMEQAIAEHRFAYTLERGSTVGLRPPPNVPTLADLPPAISNAFERAFSPTTTNVGRPTANDWVSLLDAAEKELVQCLDNRAHHYFRSAKACPWCRMEQAVPGFLAFNPVVPVGEAPLNLGEIIGTIQAVPDIKPAPALALAMPKIAIAPPTDESATRKIRLILRGAAPIFVVIGLILIDQRWPGALIGALSMFGGVVLSLYPPKAQANAAAALRVAEREWKAAEQAFVRIGDGAVLSKLRQEAMALVEQLRTLSAEESRRLNELEAGRQAAQMKRWLETHTLAQTKLKGIGPTKLVTLRSFGIETAADVQEHKILRIPGFGPSTAKTMLSWRQSVENAFRFDARRPVDARDIASIKSEVARRRAILKNRLDPTIRNLAALPNAADTARAQAISLAVPKWKKFQEVLIARRAFDFTLGENIQLCAYYIGSVLLYVGAKQFGF